MEDNNFFGNFRYGFVPLNDIEDSMQIKGEAGYELQNMEQELGLDETALGVLKELYPVIGALKLDDCRDNDMERAYNCESRKSKLERLWRVGQYNEQLISLRIILYSELKDALTEIYGNTEYDRYYTSSWLVDDFCRELLEAYIRQKPLDELYQKLEWEYFEHDKEFDDDWFAILRSLLEGTYYASVDDIKYEKCILHIFETIRKYDRYQNHEKVWVLYLLSCYGKLYSSLSDEFKLFWEDLGDWTKNTDGYNNYFIERVKPYYRIIDDRMIEQQQENSYEMLMLYQTTSLPNKKFKGEKTVVQLYKVLRQNKTLKKEYLDGERCFAAMRKGHSGKKYAAISGLCDTCNTKKLISILRKVLDSSYKVMDDDSEVAYYLPDGKCISYSDFKNSQNLTSDEINKSGRMFSCCERKLATEINPNASFNIYVKYVPCYMCSRALDQKNNGNAQIKVYYPKGKKSKESYMYKYDALAKKHLNI